MRSTTDNRETEKPGTGRRLLWFVGIWLAGVAALALFGYGLRAMLGL